LSKHQIGDSRPLCDPSHAGNHASGQYARTWSRHSMSTMFSQPTSLTTDVVKDGQPAYRGRVAGLNFHCLIAATM
jgi:hypothetical protein